VILRPSRSCAEWGSSRRASRIEQAARIPGEPSNCVGWRLIGYPPPPPPPSRDCDLMGRAVNSSSRLVSPFPDISRATAIRGWRGSARSRLPGARQRQAQAWNRVPTSWISRFLGEKKKKNLGNPGFFFLFFFCFFFCLGGPGAPPKFSVQSWTGQSINWRLETAVGASGDMRLFGHRCFFRYPQGFSVDNTVGLTCFEWESIGLYRVQNCPTYAGFCVNQIPISVKPIEL